jgi:hypothetical protein
MTIPVPVCIYGTVLVPSIYIRSIYGIYRYTVYTVYAGILVYNTAHKHCIHRKIEGVIFINWVPYQYSVEILPVLQIPTGYWYGTGRV